jgi:hypothetical protein
MPTTRRTWRAHAGPQLHGNAPSDRSQGISSTPHASSAARSCTAHRRRAVPPADNAGHATAAAGLQQHHYHVDNICHVHVRGRHILAQLQPPLFLTIHPSHCSGSQLQNFCRQCQASRLVEGHARCIRCTVLTVTGGLTCIHSPPASPSTPGRQSW